MSLPTAAAAVPTSYFTSKERRNEVRAAWQPLSLPMSRASHDFSYQGIASSSTGTDYVDIWQLVCSFDSFCCDE